LSRLGARVCLDPGQADAAAGAGRDVDDAAVARCLHSRHKCPRADEGAREVRVDDGPPVLVRDLLERTAHLADDAAGVVDEDVDAADLRCELCDLLAVGDIDGVPIDFVHRGAAAIECLGDRCADAVRSPGDESRAAGEVRHATSRAR
jgi:hypothetical protein